MADAADRAQQDTEFLENVRRTEYEIPEGESGECELCGEESPRLIGGACARCRDKYKLP